MLFLQLLGLTVLLGQVISDFSVNPFLPLIPSSQLVCDGGFLATHGHPSFLLECLHPSEQFLDIRPLVLLLSHYLRLRHEELGLRTFCFCQHGVYPCGDPFDCLPRRRRNHLQCFHNFRLETI